MVMMYVRFPLSLRNVEDLLSDHGIDLCHETVRMSWNRFGPMLAGDIRRQRVNRMRNFRQWRWHLDEMYVKLNGEMVYLWRAVDTGRVAGPHGLGQRTQNQGCAKRRRVAFRLTAPPQTPSSVCVIAQMVVDQYKRL